MACRFVPLLAVGALFLTDIVCSFLVIVGPQRIIFRAVKAVGYCRVFDAADGELRRLHAGSMHRQSMSMVSPRPCVVNRERDGHRQRRVPTASLHENGVGLPSCGGRET